MTIKCSVHLDRKQTIHPFPSVKPSLFIVSQKGQAESGPCSQEAGLAPGSAPDGLVPLGKPKLQLRKLSGKAEGSLWAS